MSSARAQAPASVGNVGVGFDLLGLSLGTPCDTVTATRIDAPGVRIDDITGVAVALPRDPARNTAGRVAQALLDEANATFGVALTIDKGIALGSGMGGSAASAVAAAVAVNAVLDAPKPLPDLLDAALVGEAVASGAVHADNVAPSLLGGLVLAAPGAPAQRIPVPAGLSCVVVRPDITINTRDGRAALRDTYSQSEWVRQAGHLAGFVDACHRGDHDAIARHLVDTLIEPQRKASIPGFDDAASAARDAGAFGFSISGSGPAVFAWAQTAAAETVASAIGEVFSGRGYEIETVVSTLSAPGARLVETDET
ncbi:MAG: homoserine kinase [Pseudomonadota bacterium]